MDSSLTWAQAMAGKKVPPGISNRLCMVNVTYSSFDGRRHRGQVVVDRALATEVRDIFAELEAAHFPIEKVMPVSRYGWSDAASMAANNSSGFNYRSVQGWSALSEHAYGRAIDINPRLNPYVRGAVVLPAGATYAPGTVGSITADGPVVKAFTKRGWKWGGSWNKTKDWQHFEKVS